MSLANKNFLGETIVSAICLNEQEINESAKLIGDKNPIHYSHEAASKVGFNSVIASGGYTASLFMAAITQYFENSASLIGLENHIFFKKPVLPNQALSIVWITESIEPKAKLNGDIVTFTGSITNENNDVLLTGIAKVLFLAD